MKAALFAGLTLSLALTAGPITYTDRIIASGSLGSANFANALVIVTVAGDTNDVVNMSPVYYNLGASTVSVAGVGVATFTNTFGVYIDQSNNPAKAGMGDFVLNNGSTIDILSSALASYDLKSAIGPISGPMFLNPTAIVPTTLGNFTLTSTSGNSTFNATLTPEPTGQITLGIGITIIASFAWFRKRGNRPAYFR